MLKLFLLRHAQAVNGFDIADKDRALTEYGINQSKELAAHIQGVDLCLCSDAMRTRMTYDGLIERGAGSKKISYRDALYNAPAGTLLDAIQNAGDNTSDVKSILLIAHNPGIHQLVNILAKDDGSREREHLRYDYAPASLTVLDCPVQAWGDIKPSDNNLTKFIMGC